jgi:hypothetical protein
MLADWLPSESEEEDRNNKSQYLRKHKGLYYVISMYDGAY